MRIPFWIWIIIGLTAVSWILPDGIPGEEFALPAIAIAGLLLRRLFMKNFYQKQYQQYQQRQQAGGKTAGSSYGSGGTQSQGSSSFYNRFRGWGSGFQQAQTVSPEKDPYEMLGVDKGAPMDEIKKAYRNKLKKFHPDIVANLKLGAEYREMFEEKTREIQRAYEQLGGK
jgi:hypothetical protein